MYIQPDECINCGVCLSVCPVQAIYDEGDLPASEATFAAANSEFFGADVTGWGAPGGATSQFATLLDHPLIRRFPLRP